MTIRVRQQPRSRRRIALRTGVPLVTLALAVTGCGASVAPGAPAGSPRSPAASHGSRTLGAGSALPSPTSTDAAPVTASTVPSATAATCTDRYLSGMTTAQRVGQLLMGGISAAQPDQAQLRTLRDNHVGSVMLTGRSTAGTTATRKLVDGFRGQADQVAGRRVGLLVATDQEGGRVQVLSGPGFSAMPSGLTQGGWPTATLRTQAAEWARQLKAAGVNLNLAPVADVVPAALGTRNIPIGSFQREYGHTADTVTSHTSAFAAGFAQSGVMTTLKHFPGLGQVIGNTDTTANVVDSVTTADSGSLAPFRAGIRAGSPFVMVSSATYTKIDPKHLAAFSPTVIDHLLRSQLGFKGVVISDDLGNAVAVRSFTPAQRAVNFIAAGGDMILTVRPSTVPAMAQGIQARMQQDASFRAKVNDSVRRILDAKHNAGQLDCG
ncbi:glycoside hydrolase family 3 protein [Streptomyces broussonetiae]|uniref:beta-N-acetylhexosaminidase n=1 Tax=Streptomyces broussonetiae TaxID=2686304 RepID=A0A6I6N2P8_9ACTN|nr:glycoside hydrolase family 3 N-terminal domain-containing protein [Streptomyces broussonetiae]QHA03125.1 glycoside hydrolase family 3 protein [Streptomyces broussonetiae]